mgnify:CR=1 FL=1
MSFSLFKATVKSSWLMFMIFLAILFMYLSIIITMFDPENMDAMALYLESLPQAMIDAFGYGTVATDLTSFIALYFYGFIVLLFPLIYCIVIANRLIAAHVDRGSMAFLLSTPNTRAKIVSTQGIYMIISITLLLALNTALGIVVCEALFPGELDMRGFLEINVATIMLTLAISSICFFFSCIFNEAKYSLAFGAGIPLLFFVINMLRNISGNYEWLQYLTIYTLFDPMEILAGDQPLITIALIFGLVTLVLYSAAVIIFSRRNLYL